MKRSFVKGNRWLSGVSIAQSVSGAPQCVYSAWHQRCQELVSTALGHRRGVSKSLGPLLPCRLLRRRNIVRMSSIIQLRTSGTLYCTPVSRSNGNTR